MCSREIRAPKLLIKAFRLTKQSRKLKSRITQGLRANIKKDEQTTKEKERNVSNTDKKKKLLSSALLRGRLLPRLRRNMLLPSSG
jgi:hypothetical protein